MKIRNRRLLALLPGAAVVSLLWLGSAPEALAQESAQKPDEAVPTTNAGAQKQEKGVRSTVTGSNILRVRTEGSLPLLELDRAYIERSGTTSASELIQSLPQMQNSRPGGFLPPAGRR